MIMRVGQGGLVHSDAVAAAIDYAWDNGANIINMSFSFEETQSAVASAINRANTAGTVMVAAVGNNNDGSFDESGVRFPASHQYVMAVGATDQNDYRWDKDVDEGSNMGPEVLVVAPGGVAAISTVDVEGSEGYNSAYQSDPGGYHVDYMSFFGGTSAAAPVVAGLAALIRSVNPSINRAQMEGILKNTAHQCYGTDPTVNDRWECGDGRSKRIQGSKVHARKLRRHFDARSHDPGW